jgi:Tfp pilus assembly protein PilX
MKLQANYPENRGFALLITLSLMILLPLFAVGLLGFGLVPVACQQ